MSRAYIQAIAGRCGLSCTLRDYDYGIDITLHEIRRKGRRYVDSGFKLDIQAKSTLDSVLTGAHVLYDLKVHAYEDLRDLEVGCPRILVLMLLPSDEAEWTSQTEDFILLRQCAYWCSLKGAAATDNRQSVRVSIPRTNVFSIEALLQLMDKIRKREPL